MNIYIKNSLILIILLIIGGVILYIVTSNALYSGPDGDNLFEKLSDDMCTENGAPLIRYYSTTWCPHCQYIDPVFDQVMSEYEGRITVKHFVIDLEAPSEEDMNEFKRFAPNGNIPAFSFGCEYYRIGNSFESSGNLAAEAQEFRRVIDILLNE